MSKSLLFFKILIINQIYINYFCRRNKPVDVTVDVKICKNVSTTVKPGAPRKGTTLPSFTAVQPKYKTTGKIPGKGKPTKKTPEKGKPTTKKPSKKCPLSVGMKDPAV